MLASKVIETLQAMIDKHGDHPVVTGVKRTSYGEPIINATFITDTITYEKKPQPVFDLTLSEESLVAKGSW